MTETRTITVAPIEDAGLVTIERDTLYNPVEREPVVV